MILINKKQDIEFCIHKILEQLEETVLLHGSEGRLLFVNSYAISKIGQNFDRGKELNAFNLYYTESRPVLDSFEDFQDSIKSGTAIYLNFETGNRLMVNISFPRLDREKIICICSNNLFVLDSADYLINLFEKMPYMAWIKDHKNDYIAFNNTALAFLNISARELSQPVDGRIFPSVIARDINAAALEAVSKGKTTKVIWSSFFCHQPDLWIETKHIPIIEDGRPGMVAAISKNVPRSRGNVNHISESKEEILNRNFKKDSNIIFVIENKKIIYVSPNFEKIFGIKISSISDDPSLIEKFVFADDIVKLYKLFLLESGYPSRYRSSIIRACDLNGNIRWYLVSSNILKVCRGYATRIGTAFDLTDSAYFERQLYKKYSELFTLYNLCNSVNYFSGYYDLVRFGIDMLKKISGVDYVDAYIYDWQQLEFKLYKTQFRNSSDYSRAYCDSQFTRIVNDRYISFEVEDIVHKKTREFFTYLGIEKIYCFPVAFDNIVYGIAVIYSKNGSAFELDSINFLQTVCNQLGLLSRNRILLDRLNREDTRRETDNEILELFFLNSSIMFFIFDNDVIHRVNDEVTKVIGWERQELSQKQYLELIHPDDRTKFAETIRLIINTGGVNEFVNRWLCKDGSYKWLEWKGCCVIEKGLFFLIANDVSEGKAMQMERLEAEQALQLEHLRNVFFANLSHEFRTPVNIILSSIQVLNDELKVIINNRKDQTDFFIKHFESLKRNSFRLLKLVNNLLDSTKIDSGYYELNFVKCNIVKLVEDIVTNSAHFFKSKDIEIVFDTDSEEIYTVCDVDSIDRIILNLISNAYKYTDPGGRIKIKLKHNDEKVIIEVKDTGCGIPENKINIIFERYRQVDNLLTRKNEGSGIGLSLVKSLVEMHKGKLSVESAVNRGSVFRIELPAADADGTDTDTPYCDEKSENRSHLINIEFSDIL